MVRDEPFVEGESVPDPEAFVEALRGWGERPDVFRFSQKITDPEARHGGRYRVHIDNFAVIRVGTYEEWLRKQARRDVREGVRRAKRDGVEVRACEFDDEFVAGIKEVYDESPMRQGRPFWHYGKSVEQVREENGTYRERSEYIGAFLGGEMIGFIKMVYVGRIAKTMQVICKEKHFRKRPTTALIAKAVEICAEKGIEYFNYGPYDYPGKKDSSLTRFKYRHGFERMDYPTYHVALTVRGRVCLGLGLHEGLRSRLPGPVVEAARRARVALRRLGSSARGAAGAG